MKLEIDAPVNGRIHKATVNVRGDDGVLLFTDMADLRAMVEREKLANRMARELGKDPAELKRKIEESWTQTLNDRESRQAAADPTAGNEAIILDAFPDEIRRPLCLVGGHAYAATWLSIQLTVRQGVAPNGEVVLYDPPEIRSEIVLAVIRDDGAVFADTPVPVPGLHPLAELEVTVRLPTSPRRTGSGVGLA